MDIKTLKNSKNKIILKQNQITTGITLKQILIDLKLCTSNGEAKRLINQNAVKINKEIIRDKDYILNQKLFIKETTSKRSIYCNLCWKKEIWNCGINHLENF